ncbi:bifunctional diaminohydroxyphosphoribosylaminopyrimidine deaminase/5-amino-6-(5-phosphoribosylamino)uracil reductase RibD [Planctomicrobium sp. SH664]|uniref:bifunctional diaminohydroxyphosphoribosylaminopyrimidine deaminase/5-amino-6-(5-phosphoribosylamino)uracil reductase RibD n=1 Tax=Planctomicrobium sp. SH664 TaxID=3448125 RepID=UPI003F5C1EB2
MDHAPSDDLNTSSSAETDVAERIMQHALSLARRGIGLVEPNPAVGAVIVDDDHRVLGEGWHQRYGGPHAEVHALQQAGDRARGATLFVTLEPCAHFGRTPPCADAVIAAGIKRVVVAVPDPAPHTAGGGLQKLRAAGIEVSVGLCREAAEELVAPFTTLFTQERPYVHAKWAMTLDGRIATRTGASRWISNPVSRARVHALRGRMDGILAGLGTVRADDPLLTARPPGPRVPTRIVLDSQALLPLTSQLVQTASEAPVLVVTGRSAPPERVESLTSAGVEVLCCPHSENDRVDLIALLKELGRRRMTNLLVEGGSGVLGSFHDLQLIDEVHCFIASKLCGGATALAPIGGLGLMEMPQHSSLLQPTVEILDGDLYLRGRVRRST